MISGSDEIAEQAIALKSGSISSLRILFNGLPDCCRVCCNALPTSTRNLSTFSPPASYFWLWIFVFGWRKSALTAGISPVGRAPLDSDRLFISALRTHFMVCCTQGSVKATSSSNKVCRRRLVQISRCCCNPAKTKTIIAAHTALLCRTGKHRASVAVPGDRG